MGACFKVIDKIHHPQTGEFLSDKNANPEIHNKNNDCVFFRPGLLYLLLWLVQRSPIKYCNKCFHWKDPLAGLE